MSSGKLTRLETSLLAEDAELLKRVAERRGTTTAELIRAALYNYVEPLKRAAHERDLTAFMETEERRRMRHWKGDEIVP